MENEEKSLVDQDLVDQSINVLGTINQGIQNSTADSQITSELQQDDPRDNENWGISGVAEELKSAVLGGVQDTASSIQTFPERVIDTLSGEVSREK